MTEILSQQGNVLSYDITVHIVYMVYFTDPIIIERTTKTYLLSWLCLTVP